MSRHIIREAFLMVWRLWFRNNMRRRPRVPPGSRPPGPERVPPPAASPGNLARPIGNGTNARRDAAAPGERG